MLFSVAEGAGAHRHVSAHRLAFGRIHNWLDDIWGTLHRRESVEGQTTSDKPDIHWLRTGIEDGRQYR